MLRWLLQEKHNHPQHEWVIMIIHERIPIEIHPSPWDDAGFAVNLGCALCHTLRTTLLLSTLCLFLLHPPPQVIQFSFTVRLMQELGTMISQTFGGNLVVSLDCALCHAPLLGLALPRLDLPVRLHLAAKILGINVVIPGQECLVSLLKLEKI